MSEQPYNYNIETFDEAIDYIMDLVGSQFEHAVRLTNTIINNPSDYTGPQALTAALKLSGYRVLIGVAAQNAKIKSAHTKKPTDRLIKDALMVLYDGLLELINCLKAIARTERELLVNG